MPNRTAALSALHALIGQKHLLASLEVFHHELGHAFQIALPGFRATMLAGQEANHLVLVTAREHFQWRNEGDPVTKLLRHGVLVEDGETHDALRQVMSPPLHRAMLGDYVQAMGAAPIRLSMNGATMRVLTSWSRCAGSRCSS